MEYVEFLIKATEKKTIPSTHMYNQQISSLYGHAKLNGLKVEELGKIFAALKTLDLNAAQVKQLVQCMIPKQRISRNIIAKILTFILCTDPFEKANLVSCLLIWIASLLDFQLVDEDAVREYYNAIELRFESFPKPVSHILYVLTKPEDVLPIRVQKLERMIDIYGEKEPYLCALLSHYKALSPALGIQARTYKKCEKVFTYKEPFYLKLRDGLRQMGHDDSSVKSIVVPFKRPENPATGKAIIVPTIQYVGDEKAGDLKFHSVKSVTQLAKNFEKITFPSHTLSLLNSEIGIYALLMHQRSVQYNFLQNLQAVLEKNFLSYPEQSPIREKQKLLNDVIDLHLLFQQGFTSVSKFLREYLFFWDGIQFNSQIYALVEWFVFESETDLSRYVLYPLHTLFVAGDPDTMCCILRCLTNLIVNLYMTKQKYSHNETNLYEENVLKTEVQLTPVLRKLSKFMSHLFKIALYTYPCDNQILLTAIIFYKKINKIEDQFDDVTIISSSVLYYSLLSFNAPLLGEVCTLMPSYREKMKEDPGDDSPRIRSKLDRLDFYINDMFNFLWMSKAFKERKTGKIFFNLESEHEEMWKNYVNLNVAFDFFRHIMFEPFRNVLAHEKNVPRNSLNSKEELLSMLKKYVPSVGELIEDLCIIHNCTQI